MNKKVFATLLVIFMMFGILPNTSFTTVVEGYSDDSYYPMACDLYEVSQISNGGFNKVSCHSDFNEAKSVMRTNKDYVVRYSNSYSPTKIVAMNSGIVSIYPGRTGDDLAYIYQNMDVRDSFWKNTYCGEHNEAIYIDTPTMSSSYYPYGAVKINLKGFEGYMTLKNVDLIPTQFLENGWKLWLGGENQSYDEDPYDAIIDQDYYMLVSDVKYTSMQYTYHYTWSKKHTMCTTHSYIVDNGTNYLNAGMKAGVRYYSADGINFYSDRGLNNFVAKVYNYYQFLPLRTKTDISASTFNNYIYSKVGSSSVMCNEGSTFINAQNRYGANALLVYAMACHEAGFGTSYYSNDRYNLFGWGAYDSNPGNAKAYGSLAQCVEQHMGQNLRYYMDYDHSYYYGTCLGNKGTGFNVLYASDPNWSIKIASYAYEIDKYANGNNGNLTDYNKYTVGVVNTFDSNIYKKNTGNDVLYTGRFGKNYQKDLTVVILQDSGNRYQIQSTNPVVNGNRLHQEGLYEYNWNDSVGYIDYNYVDILNGKTAKQDNTPSIIKGTPTYEPYTVASTISMDNEKLSITGIGVIQGMDFDTNNKTIKHEIVFYDINTNTEVYSFVANTVDSNGYSMNDGYDYKMTGFEASINLQDIPLKKGSYTLKLRTTNNDKTLLTNLRNSKSNYRMFVANDSTYTYKFYCNYLYNYRFEFDIIDTPLDYTEINKPYAKQSFVTYENINIDENGDLNIDGAGIIYYLDYTDAMKQAESIKYDVYLVDDNENYIKLNTTLRNNEFDYTTSLNSKYDFSNVSFHATTNGLDKKLVDLDGDYSVILRIQNGEYIDILEMTNRANAEFNGFVTDEKEVSIYTSNIRKRIMVSVTTIGD